MSYPDHHSPRRPTHLHARYIGAVWLGGSLGTVARYVISTEASLHWGPFPLATFVTNLSGAFLLGALLALLGRAGRATGRVRLVQLFVGTGFLGGFTTYSALANDAVRLWQAGLVAQAVGYALGTVLLGAVASLAGIVAGARLRRSKSR
jgi:CrcB protein